jgi:hypothetical protein
MEVTGVLINRNATINKLVHETPKVNHENATGTIMGIHATKTPY